MDLGGARASSSVLQHVERAGGVERCVRHGSLHLAGDEARRFPFRFPCPGIDAAYSLMPLACRFRAPSAGAAADVRAMLAICAAVRWRSDRVQQGCVAAHAKEVRSATAIGPRRSRGKVTGGRASWACPATPRMMEQRRRRDPPLTARPRGFDSRAPTTAGGEGMGWVDAGGCGILALAAACRCCGGAPPRDPLSADKAYLWHGVQQVSLADAGRIATSSPHEPGRYLWVALFARAFGAGLLPLCAAPPRVLRRRPSPRHCNDLRARGLDWPATALAAFALSAIAHPAAQSCSNTPAAARVIVRAWLLSAPSPVAWACEDHLGVSLLFGFNLFLYASAGFALALAVATTTSCQPFAAAWPDGGLQRSVHRRAFCRWRPWRCRRDSRRVLRPQDRHRDRARESNLSFAAPLLHGARACKLLGLDPAHRRAFQWTFLLLPCCRWSRSRSWRCAPCPRWTRRRCSPRRWGWPRSTTPPAAPILRTSCSRWRPRACCCWVVRRRSHRGGSRRSRP